MHSKPNDLILNGKKEPFQEDQNHSNLHLYLLLPLLGLQTMRGETGDVIAALVNKEMKLPLFFSSLFKCPRIALSRIADHVFDIIQLTCIPHGNGYALLIPLCIHVPINHFHLITYVSTPSIQLATCPALNYISHWCSPSSISRRIRVTASWRY